MVLNCTNRIFYCSSTTLHRNLPLTGNFVHFAFLKKTHSVWFISHLNYGDTEIVLINHLLLVIPAIPMSLYKFVFSQPPPPPTHTHNVLKIYRSLACSSWQTNVKYSLELPKWKLFMHNLFNLAEINQCAIFSQVKINSPHDVQMNVCPLAGDVG